MGPVTDRPSSAKAHQERDRQGPADRASKYGRERIVRKNGTGIDDPRMKGGIRLVTEAKTVPD